MPPTITHHNRRARLLIIGLIALGALAYHNSFAGVFVFDDIANIYENPNVQSLTPITKYLSATRPLLDLTLAVNYALGGDDPFGYHLLNLTIHLAAAVVLFALIRRTLASPGIDGRSRRWHDGFAFAVAALWVVHPLTTQAVTYIIQRGESMASLFILLTLLTAARSAEPQRGNWGREAFRGRGVWMVLAVVCCALGMLSKQITAAAPLLVVLYDRTFIYRTWRDTFARRWALYVGLASTWLILAASLGFGRELVAGDNSVGFTSQGASPWDYLGTQAGVILHYLRLSLLPMGQNFDYGWRIEQFGIYHLPAMAAIGAVLIGALFATWRGHWLGFVGLMFFGILAPTSSIIPVADAAVEHRMYLPLVAVLVIAVAIARTIMVRIAATRGGSARDAYQHVSRAALLCTLGVVVVLGGLTVARNRIYYSRASVWRSVLARNADNPRAHSNLGKALRLEGESALAIAHLREALRLAPDYALASYNLGAELLVVGQPGEAIDALKQSLVKLPRYKFAHFQLGLAHAALEQDDAAIACYKTAIALDNDYMHAHYNLAALLAKRGDNAACIDHLRQVVRIDPQFAMAHLRLGYLLHNEGRHTEAAVHLSRCIELEGNNPNALRLLADTMAALDAQTRNAMAEVDAPID